MSPVHALFMFELCLPFCLLNRFKRPHGGVLFLIRTAARNILFLFFYCCEAASLCAVPSIELSTPQLASPFGSPTYISEVVSTAMNQAREMRNPILPGFGTVLYCRRNARRNSRDFEPEVFCSVYTVNPRACSAVWTVWSDFSVFQSSHDRSCCHVMTSTL